MLVINKKINKYKLDNSQFSLGKTREVRGIQYFPDGGLSLVEVSGGKIEQVRHVVRLASLVGLLVGDLQLEELGNVVDERQERDGDHVVSRRPDVGDLHHSSV